MKKQLSLEKEPKSLSEVCFQPAVVNTLKKYIKKEIIPQALYFYGKPGTGKTSTAKAFIRTLRCLDRKEGHIEPCGKCSVCTSTEDIKFSHESSNVMWIQRGLDDSNMKSQIEKITEYIQYPPSYGSKFKFVVIDELQALSANYIYTFLTLSESLPLIKNNVIFIFITMNDDSLPETVRDALTSRTIPFEFISPTTDSILSHLIEQFPHFPPSSLSIISRESERNMRRVYTLLQRCIENDNEELQTDLVADTLNVIDDDKRIKLWSLLQSNSNKSYDIIKFTTELLKQGGIEKSLVRDLIEDIQYCIENDKKEDKLEDQFQTILLLADYLASAAPIPLPTFFFILSMKKLKPINIDILSNRHSKDNGFAIINNQNDV